MWKQCICSQEKKTTQGWFVTEEVLALLSSRLEEVCDELKKTQSQEWEAMLSNFFEEADVRKISTCKICYEAECPIDEPTEMEGKVIYLKSRPSSQAV
jgi:hypothetical protein